LDEYWVEDSRSDTIRVGLQAHGKEVDGGVPMNLAVSLYRNRAIEVNMLLLE